MSVYISSLPVYTGTAADLRWFIMNNSGNTQTFKYSGYSSPYKVVGTTNSNNIYDTNAMGGDFSSIVAGENNAIPSPAGRNFIGGGTNNNITGSQDSVILGSYDSIIRAVGRCGIYSSYQGDITQTPNYQCAIIASAYSSLGYGNATAIIGGYFNTINGTDNNESIIIGGKSNTLTSTLDGTILNGVSNTLTSSTGSTIVGGNNNTITNSTDSSIIGGTGNTMSGKTNVVMLGTTGRTALYDNTTHVENSHNFKTESFGVTNAGSVGGSINVDCSLGTLFYFTITANTTPNFINWKEGQRIQFYVDNSGSFTVPTATITGGGSVYAKSGSLNPTNNEITAYYGTIVNGNLFLDEHLNFQPV